LKWFVTSACPYPCSDDTILHQDLTNALIYINNTVFTLKHSYTF